MKKKKNKFKIKEYKELNWCREYDTVYEVYYGKKYLDSFRDDPKKLIKKFNKIIKIYIENYT